MVLLIDNYDSFSYNVYQLIGGITSEVKVIRNDEMTVEEVAREKPKAIVLSPGPGRPEAAGICCDVVRRLSGTVKIRGICLGHQAICQVYGAKITYAGKLLHGKQSEVFADGDSRLFAGMEKSFLVARYHSLAAAAHTIPACLHVSAWTADGEVMAVEHRVYPVFGVQFHPESVLTPEGKKVMENFLAI